MLNLILAIFLISLGISILVLGASDPMYQTCDLKGASEALISGGIGVLINLDVKDD